MTATAIFDLICPTFKDHADKASYIAMAEMETNRSWYGELADKAVALRAAHNMTLSLSGIRAHGETGAISSKREGDASINFVAGAGQGIGDLDQTFYGKQLKNLQKTGGPIMGVSGGFSSAF